MNKWDLKVGEKYVWRDENVLLLRFVREKVVLERTNGQMITVATSEFVNERPVPINIDPSVIKNPDPSFFDKISKAALKRAEVLQDHLEAVIHGVESSDNSEYDPEVTTLTQRITTKAKELNMQLSSLWRLKKEYERSGLYGLIDRRGLPLARSQRNDTDPLIKAIETVITQTATNSDVPNTILHRKIKEELAKKLGDSYAIPSVATLNRLMMTTRHRLGLNGNANQRQKASLTPKKLFGSFRATRPGQLVMFDSSRLDMFALNATTADWIQVALTIAYDFYTRSIVGWRFTPVDTKGVDVALILFDLLHPKIAMPDWESIAYWNYFGVPTDIRIIEYTIDENQSAGENTSDQESREQLIAGIPYGKPDTVLIDHGKVYVSRTFQDVCTRLGIHVQRARVRRPTDKSPIENVFKQISAGFCARLAGHKGRNVAARGIDVENKALYYIEEIDALFTEWVATHWQNQTPRTMYYPVPGALDEDVSPNDAYALGLTQTGFISIPNLSYFDCLETEYRIVDSVGITIQYLQYDSIELEPFRKYPSEITSGPHRGDYRIKADPRDRSQIFFYDEIRKTWITIPWRGKQQFPHSFSDVLLAYAKAIAVERLHGKKPTHDDIAIAIEEMYTRWDAREYKTQRERRSAGRNATLTQQAKKDWQRKNDSIVLKSTSVETPISPQEQAIPADLGDVFQRFDQIRSKYQEDDDEF